MPRKPSKPAKSLAASQAARARLKAIAVQLRAVARTEKKLRQAGVKSPPTIVPADADWLAGGIYGYLRGKHPSLDHALGLVRSRGRVAKQREIAIEAAECRRSGLTWKQTGERLGRTPAELQQIVARYAPDVAAHNVRRVAEQVDTVIELVETDRQR